MENMSIEIVEAIKDYYEDDKDLIANCLFYMYHTTNDSLFKLRIEDEMYSLGYCIDCNSELLTYEWEEIHWELDDNYSETFHAKLCPICDKAEISRCKYKEI